MSKFRMSDRAAAQISTVKQGGDILRLKGYWRLEHYRQGKLIHSEEAKNLIVDVGLQDVLDVALLNGTPKAGWFVGLKNTGAVQPGDTMASHPNWTENTTYAGTDRPAWTAVRNTLTVTNTASKASFAINGSTTVAGAFLSDAQPNSPGNTGLLLAAVDFAAPRAVNDGDNLQVTYEITAAGS